MCFINHHGAGVLMELAKTSVHSLLRDASASLTFEDRVDIALQLSKGLEVLHRKFNHFTMHAIMHARHCVSQFLHDKKKIVHGDLKSLNALYVEAGSCFKWCDFGFSKKIKSVQSLASAAATVALDTGTPFWKAPELFARQV